MLRQNVNYLVLWVILTSLLIIISFLPGIPVAAKDPSGTSISEECVPDPFPLSNKLNPKSPLYDPSKLYGPAGTRFGPPRQKGRDLPPISSSASANVESSDNLDFTNHHWFGTGINSGSNIIGVRAYQQVSNTLALNSVNNFLFAPTLMAPNYCPLEAVFDYAYNGSSTVRTFQIFDHGSNQWIYITDLDSTFFSNYVRNSYAYNEIINEYGTWYACLYNYNTGYWDIKRQSIDSGGRSDGWDIWEEYDLDANWPSLPQIRSNTLNVKIGSTWYYTSSTYATQSSDLPGGFPYSHGWYNQYYDWYVGS